jgi:hypothetical protein
MFTVELGAALVQGVVIGTASVLGAPSHGGGCAAVVDASQWALFAVGVGLSAVFCAARPFAMPLGTVLAVVMNAWSAVVALVTLYGTEDQAAQATLGQAIVGVTLLGVPVLLAVLELLGFVRLRHPGSQTLPVDRHWLSRSFRRDGDQGRDLTDEGSGERRGREAAVATQRKQPTKNAKPADARTAGHAESSGSCSRAAVDDHRLHWSRNALFLSDTTDTIAGPPPLSAASLQEVRFSSNHSPNPTALLHWLLLMITDERRCSQAK